ncbi:MAG TPA: MFS transporter, partial [Ilumatobacteraceae bacterium]
TAGWGDVTVIGSLLIGFGFIGGFLMWELHSSHPMLDVRVFQNRRFSSANIAITLVFFAMFGQAFLATQYLQTVLGFSALGSGLRMLPMAIAMALLAPVAPRLVERVGTKIVVGVGLLVVVAGLVIVSTVPVADGYPHLLVGFFLVAAGMAMTMAPATESIMGSLPRAKAGVGSAMNDTTRQMGGALGVAILGSASASLYRPGLARHLGSVTLTPTQLAHAKDSLGGAIDVAKELPAAAAAHLTAVAKSEFVSGMRLALLVAVAVVTAAAIVVFMFLPARAADVDDAAALDVEVEVAEEIGALT